MRLHFYKYHGTGNDFIVLAEPPPTPLTQQQVAALCHRRFGIGADGMIVLQPDKDADFFMLYYNSDGRVSSFCGNGGRCAAWAANLHGLCGGETTFMASDGLHHAEILDKRGEEALVKLKMQDVPKIEKLARNLFRLDTGSPHLVVFEKDIEGIDIKKEGAAVRYSPEYAEQGINVNFAKESGRAAADVRTYERGVEDETWACGTGAVAAGIAFAAKNALSGPQQVNVKMPGGQLQVDFDMNGNQAGNVWLTGNAVRVFKGEVSI